MENDGKNGKLSHLGLVNRVTNKCSYLFWKHESIRQTWIKWTKLLVSAKTGGPTLDYV